MDDLPIIVRGTKVVLTPARREDVPTYWKWICDPEVNRTLSDIGACVTIENEYSWYDDRLAKPSPDLFHVDVHLAEGFRLIGNGELFDINQMDGTAELGILIGEKDCWGHGCGTEAVALIAKYGFDILHLHNIMLRAAAYNTRGLAAYRTVGFREIGRRRGVDVLERERFDEVLMDLLADELKMP
ncbi:MAG: GNAT family protein [Caldisericota bacterium]|jgi:RimJ/RimL family protein N-acetyltransferase|nr:GNAT family protein [Caldisericota bacterium]